VNEHNGIVSARVTTAAPVFRKPEDSGGKLAGIAGKLSKRESKTDADLLGGVVVQIGSTMFDGSIRTQLAEMKRRLTENC
jgi:F-type H+-transporting ATPase subunit delta